MDKTICYWAHLTSGGQIWRMNTMCLFAFEIDNVGDVIDNLLLYNDSVYQAFCNMINM